MRAFDPWLPNGDAAAARRALAHESYRARWARRRRWAALCQPGAYRGWREAEIVTAERRGHGPALAAIRMALREAIRIRRRAQRRRRWDVAPEPWEFADPYRAAGLIDRLWAVWLAHKAGLRVHIALAQAGSVGSPAFAQS